MFWKRKDRAKDRDYGKTNEPLKADTARIPAFLSRPADPVAERFFSADMITVSDKKCGYKVDVYGNSAGVLPQIVQHTTGYEIDEVHIYYKKDSPSWYVISTMKTPAVRTSPLSNAVLAPYNLSKSFGMYEPMLNVPQVWAVNDYESLELYDLGAWSDYDRERGLEESHVFCHVFKMNRKMYKDFILAARKDIYSWKLECLLETQTKEISQADFVPPGYFFGTFTPLI